MFRSRAQSAPDLDRSLELVSEQASATAAIVDAATEATPAGATGLSTGSRRLEAAREALDALAPRVEAARAALAPRMDAARGALTPRVEAAREALDALAPRLETARVALGPRVSAARDSLTPRMEAARDSVSPRVEAALEGLAPRLESALEAATHAGGPVAAQARQRGANAIAALRGDLPTPARATRWRTALSFLGIGAAAGTCVGIMARRPAKPPTAPPIPPPWQSTAAPNPSTGTASDTVAGAVAPTFPPAVSPVGAPETTVFDTPVPAMPAPLTDETITGIEPEVILLPDADGADGPSDAELERS